MSSMFGCWRPSILLLNRLFIDFSPFVRDSYIRCIFEGKRLVSIFSLKEGKNSKTDSLMYVVQMLSQLVFN